MNGLMRLRLSDAPGAVGDAGWRPVLSRVAVALSPARRRSFLVYAAIPALSVLNAVVGLLMPAILGPSSFGEYSLAVTLFQYGLIFDFGLAQIIDRRVPVLVVQAPSDLDGFVATALGTRLYIAVGSAIVFGLALIGLAAGGRLPFRLADGLLSLAGGLCFMLALGPMSVSRAMSQRRAFAVASIACGLVLAAGRTGGVLIAGTTGSFVALLVGYGVIAATLRRGAAWSSGRPSLRDARALVFAGLPLFITSLVWAVYMTANRWVVSSVTGAVELGHFAFGANVLALLVGTIAAMAQLYYPAVVTRVAAGAPYSMSARVLRDLVALGAGVAIMAVAGIVAGPTLIDFAYPKFIESGGLIRIFLVGLPGLVVSSWLMPLALSTAARPWLEGVLTYPLGLCALVVLTKVGFQVGGLPGAAWGSVGAALILLLLQVVGLRQSRLMSLPHAAALLGVTAALTAILSALAWAI